jgi:hypothetical protein
MWYNGRPKGNALRAHAYGVGGILNVCAGDVLAGCCEEACTDVEVGIWACFCQSLLRRRGGVSEGGVYSKHWIWRRSPFGRWFEARFRRGCGPFCVYAS